MIDSLLKRFQAENLLDWGMLLFAWKGIPNYNFMDCKVLTDDIADFAIKEIEKKEDYVSPTLIDLYSAGLFSKEEVTSYLEDICEEENIDLELSYKRWQVLMIEVVIDCLYRDYLNNDDNYIIDGLGILMDVWQAWNEPKDIPYYTFEETSPEQLYSREGYGQFLEYHKSWIERQKQKLF